MIFRRLLAKHSQFLEHAAGDRRVLQAVYKNFKDDSSQLGDYSIEVAKLLCERTPGSRTARDRLLLRAAEAQPSSRFLECMICILDDPSEEAFHELAVEVLTDLADPAGVPCLARVLERASDSEASMALAVKAIEALAATGTEDAIAHVRLCVDSLVPRLVEEAMIQLEE